MACIPAIFYMELHAVPDLLQPRNGKPEESVKSFFSDGHLNVRFYGNVSAIRRSVFQAKEITATCLVE